MTVVKNTLTAHSCKDLSINQSVIVPGDKSISHRSMIMASIAEGVSEVSGFLTATDCLATKKAMQDMGVKIEQSGSRYIVHGVGKYGLKRPESGQIDCGNSGTGIRLLSGILAAQSFSSTISGDHSLNSRPMNRIRIPLDLMGADVRVTENGTAPINFMPVQQLNAIHYKSPVASAQIKSCVLLSGLYAQGETILSEPKLSRDHTENMLRGFGVELESRDCTVKMQGKQKLEATTIVVPADISSAAFFMVLATLLPSTQLVFHNLCVNPTRTGVIDILRLMGANITMLNERVVAGERIADVEVKSSQLTGIVIPEKYIASAIDEFPIIFVAAALAKGQTVLRNAEELRKKESDRIAVMATGLRALGIDCEEFDDGLCVQGGQHDGIGFKGGHVDAHGDHRCAMSFLIAGQFSQKPITVTNCENIITSFPSFLTIANDLGLNIS